MQGLAHVFSRREAPLAQEELEKITGVKRVRELRNFLGYDIYEVTFEKSVFEVRVSIDDDLLPSRVGSEAFESISSVWTHPWVGDDIAKATHMIVFRSERPFEQVDLRILVGGVGDALDGTTKLEGRYQRGWHVIARPRRPERKEPLAPHARQVAQRALIHAAIRRKANAMWRGEPGEGGLMALRMCEWMDTGILREELSEEEHDFLCTLPVGLDLYANIRMNGRVEGLPILAWALGLAPLPRFDEPVAESLFDSLGLFDELPAIVKHAKLRPEEEIARLRIAMADFDRNLVQSERDRQLTIGEKIDKERYHHERRRAVRWLLGVAPSYGDASPEPFCE